MKIAVNTRLLVPDKMDGIGRFTFETIQVLAKKNPSIEFHCLFDRKTPSSFAFPENVKLIHLAPPARAPLLWWIWFEISLKNYLNKNNFDIFLSPEGWVPSGLNCKSLAVVHDLNFLHHPENVKWSHRWYLQYFFPKYIKRADRIATVSEYSKEDISKTFGIPSKNIDVVYNGANAIFASQVSDEKKREIKDRLANSNDFFLFIGTIHPRKNLNHLFEAFEIFKRKGNAVKLLIAGNRKWWPKELEQLYHSLNSKDEIIFLGRKSDEELAELLQSALALTYVPYFEGFGIPILEAFLAKTAVISSNCTSMPEVAGDAALLVDPHSSEDIAKAMQQIYSDEELRKTLINKGSLIAKKYSWEKSSNLLMESILKTINAT